MRSPAGLRRSALGLTLVVAACHSVPGPERVLDDYFDHLAHDRIAAAYALTTPAYRARPHFHETLGRRRHRLRAGRRVRAGGRVKLAVCSRR